MAPSSKSAPTESAKSGPLKPGLFKGLLVKIGSVSGPGDDGHSVGSQASSLSSSSSCVSQSPSGTSALKFAKARSRATNQGLLPGRVPEDLRREIAEAITGAPKDPPRSTHSGPIPLRKGAQSPGDSLAGSLASLYHRSSTTNGTSPGSPSSPSGRARLPKERSLDSASSADRTLGASPGRDRSGARAPGPGRRPAGAAREPRSASDGAAGHRAVPSSRFANGSARRKSSSCGSVLGNLDEHQEVGAGPEGDQWEDIEPPAEFVCPLSQRVMYDPVIVSSGQTYERAFILRWLADGHAACPKTSQNLDPSAIVANQVLKMVIADWCKQNGVPLPTPRSPGLNFTLLSREGGGDGDGDEPVVPTSTASEGSSRHVVQRSRRAAERASRAADRALESERRQRTLRNPAARGEASGKAAAAPGGQVVFMGAAGGGAGAVSRPQSLRRAPKITAYPRIISEACTEETEEDAGTCLAGQGVEAEGTPREGQEEEDDEEEEEEGESVRRSPSFSPPGSLQGSFKGDPYALSAWPGQLAMQGSLFRRTPSEPRPSFRSPTVASVEQSQRDEGGRRAHAHAGARGGAPGRATMGRSSTVDGGSMRSSGGLSDDRWEEQSVGSGSGDLQSVDVEELVENIRSGAPPEDQAAGAALLRVLTRNGFRNARKVVSSGAVRPLVELTEAEDEPTVVHAVTTILNLVLDERLKHKVGQEQDLVPSLVRVLGTGAPEARANAAAALCCVSTLDGVRERACGAGAVPRLVDLLRDGSPSAKKDAANALVSLTMSKDNRPTIAESGVVRVLCRLIDQGVDAVEEQTGAIFAGLVRDPGGRKALADGGAIEALAELLEGGATPKTREYAISALLGLAVNSQACLAAIDAEGLYTSIDVLTRTGSDKAQAKASALLEMLRRFDANDV